MCLSVAHIAIDPVLHVTLSHILISAAGQHTFSSHKLLPCISQPGVLDIGLVPFMLHCLSTMADTAIFMLLNFWHARSSAALIRWVLISRAVCATVEQVSGSMSQVVAS